MKQVIRLLLLPALLTFLLISSVFGSEWSETELHLQYGNLDAPSFAGGETARTSIVTLQNSSGWKYGQNFFFVDFAFDDNTDGFNEASAFAEFIPTLNLNDVTGSDLSIGPVRALGLVLGLNVATSAKKMKVMPGLKLFFDAPGFAYLNTDIMRYIDKSRGLDKGGAPAEDDSWQIDTAFLFPFSVGQHRFSVTGHVEYVHARKNDLGDDIPYSVLSQTQFRYDLGHAVWEQKDRLFVGIEYQYWRNKLGDPSTTESAPQLLIVWRF
ncbi:hypothetical protein NBRC116494_36670 [Aurantivibrio plasticivorans]